MQLGQNVGLHKSGFLNSNQVKSNHMFLKKIQVKSNQVKTSLKFPKSSQVKSLDFEKKVKSSQVKSESVKKKSSQVKSSQDSQNYLQIRTNQVRHSKQTLLDYVTGPTHIPQLINNYRNMLGLIFDRFK